MLTGMFAFMTSSFMFSADAAHMQGHIVQNTVWTLTDSPYVIIGNVTIDPNVALTIESGVFVKFGGNFSFIVEGTLYAMGTAEKPVTFTSNKLSPTPGDWGTIKFTSNTVSTLEYCHVEYATDGVTVEDGSVSITHSEISHNLLNGIYIFGSVNVNVVETSLEANANGIFAGGDASGIVIQRNQIFLNSENGIYLYANESTQIDSTSILDNVVSANPVGIYVYGLVRASIMGNSIAYNDLGILYSNATDIMPLEGNDLYGNSISARAQFSDSVSAEHNYWGDPSGPYHVSMNPKGKGNTVESNGTDLDFLPFLTINNSYINQAPVANLVTDKQVVAPTDEVTFIAAFSEDDRQVYQYFFDFGDGRNSGWTTTSIFVYKYDSIGTYEATLTVMDDFGVASVNTASVTMNVRDDLLPLNVDLTLNTTTVTYGEQISLLAHVTSESNAIENAAITILPIKEGTVLTYFDYTDATGYFTATFTAPNITQVTNIRIIAIASKDGYVQTSNYAYLHVLPPLLVQMNVEQDVLKSEETTNITIQVTYEEQPVVDADVWLSFDVAGDVSTMSLQTDVDGLASTLFTATSTSIPLNVAVSATVTKSGYIQGETQGQISVEPKLLDVSITVAPDTLLSEEASTIETLVTYEGSPLENAEVSVSSDSGGRFSVANKLTDEDGNATFIFTSPAVAENTTVTVTATVNKLGYVVKNGTVTILVTPGKLTMLLMSDSSQLEPRKAANITVYVKHDQTPVANVMVSITAETGTFSGTSGLTDANGFCSFIFTAPETTLARSITVVANASKLGFVGDGKQVTIQVIPKAEEFWSLTTILMIVIPIVIAVVVVVLVKMKILVISLKEEGAE